MRVNEEYAHSPEPIYPQYLIRRDIRQEILGATGT